MHEIIWNNFRYAMVALKFCELIQSLSFVQIVYSYFRKSFMSVTFAPTILGPEMAASISWTPGSFSSFCWKNPHTHTIPRFRGGGGFWAFLGEGGGVANFIFYGRGGFSFLLFAR